MEMKDLENDLPKEIYNLVHEYKFIDNKNVLANVNKQLLNIYRNPYYRFRHQIYSNRKVNSIVFKIRDYLLYEIDIEEDKESVQKVIDNFWVNIVMYNCLDL